jgi:hypothetical protein
MERFAEMIIRPRAIANGGVRVFFSLSLWEWAGVRA